MPIIDTINSRIQEDKKGILLFKKRKQIIDNFQPFKGTNKY